MFTILAVVTVSLLAGERIPVRVVNQYESRADYIFFVADYISQRSDTNAVRSPAGQAGGSYRVRGATIALQLPDKRIAVVNCDPRRPSGGAAMTGPRCRMPLVDHIQAEFKAGTAKLFWLVSVDGVKYDSETYKLVAVLQRAPSASADAVPATQSAGPQASPSASAPAAISAPVRLLHSSYPGLPRVNGYTAREVGETLGPAVTVGRRTRGVEVWTFATPDGERFVYLSRGIASMTDPRKEPRGLAAAPGCREAPHARQVSIIANDTPAYAAPRVRTDATERLQAGAVVRVIRLSGAWFAVDLPTRGAGYVHCSDVRVLQ